MTPSLSHAHNLAEAFHYLSAKEVDCLQSLARFLRPNPIVVNIGAGAGTSGLAFLEAREDLTLITIDVRADDNPYGSLFAESEVIKRAGLSHRRHYQVHGESQKVGIQYKEVDMVFVDGGHEYEECFQDIKRWWKKIKKFGIMALHDYDKITAYYAQNPFEPHTQEHIDLVVKPYPGVDKAVTELLSGRYPIKSHVDTIIAFEKR